MRQTMLMRRPWTLMLVRRLNDPHDPHFTTENDDEKEGKNAICEKRKRVGSSENVMRYRRIVLRLQLELYNSGNLSCDGTVYLAMLTTSSVGQGETAHSSARTCFNLKSESQQNRRKRNFSWFMYPRKVLKFSTSSVKRWRLANNAISRGSLEFQFSCTFRDFQSEHTGRLASTWNDWAWLWLTSAQPFLASLSRLETREFRDSPRELDTDFRFSF